MDFVILVDKYPLFVVVGICVGNWCALVTMSTSAEASSGVYFVPEDPINPVYNSWLVTVSVNLQPYICHLGSLRGEVKNFKCH